MTSTPSRLRAPGEKRSLPHAVSLTLALWSALLRICPRAFRTTYAAEMEQVFRAMLLDAWLSRGLRGVARLWAPALGDLLVGAAGAHGDDLGLTIESLKRSWLMSRMRSSAITIFSAYIALVLTGMGFQKLTEDIMKTSLPTTYPGVRLTYEVIVVGAVLALIAALVGGLPIAWASFRQALAARRFGLLALWAVPPLSLLVWLGWTWTLLNVILPNNSELTIHNTNGLWLARSWVALFILAAIVSVAAVARAVNLSDVPPRWYRFALRAAVVTTFGMLVTLAGVVAFAWQVQAYAPANLAGLASPLLFGESTGASLVFQVAIMLIATIIAAYGVFRGLSAPPTRPDATAALA